MKKNKMQQFFNRRKLNATPSKQEAELSISVPEPILVAFRKLQPKRRHKADAPLGIAKRAMKILSHD